MQKLMLVLAVLVVFASCKKSDTTPSNENLIVGKWYVTYEKFNEYYNGAAHINETSKNPTDSSFVTFTNTGLMIDHYYDDVYNSQTQQYKKVETNDTSFYSINGNQLRVISKEVGDTTFATIQTLNSSTLSIYSKNQLNSSDATSYFEDWTTLKK